MFSKIISVFCKLLRFSQEFHVLLQNVLKLQLGGPCKSKDIANTLFYYFKVKLYLSLKPNVYFLQLQQSYFSYSQIWTNFLYRMSRGRWKLFTFLIIQPGKYSRFIQIHPVWRSIFELFIQKYFLPTKKTKFTEFGLVKSI